MKSWIHSASAKIIFVSINVMYVLTIVFSIEVKCTKVDSTVVK